LVANEVGRETHQREISTLLSNDFVARGEWNEVRKALERNGVAVMHVGRNGGL
jgi:hypothetical protein